MGHIPLNVLLCIFVGESLSGNLLFSVTLCVVICYICCSQCWMNCFPSTDLLLQCMQGFQLMSVCCLFVCRSLRKRLNWELKLFLFLRLIWDLCPLLLVRLCVCVCVCVCLCVCFHTHMHITYVHAFSNISFRS